jgi:hypothetical protein
MKRLFIFAVLWMLVGCTPSMTKGLENNEKVGLTDEVVQFNSNGLNVVYVQPQGSFAEIKVEESNEAIEKLLSGNTVVRDDILKNPNNYTPPVLYVLSNVLFNEGMKDEGAFWFYTAQLRARIDANLCADHTARSAVSLLTNRFGTDINLYTFENMDNLKAIIERVVEYIKSNDVNYDIRWINLHGLKAFSSESVEEQDLSIPTDEWESTITKTIGDYYKGFMNLYEMILDEEKDIKDLEVLSNTLVTSDETQALIEYIKSMDSIDYDIHCYSTYRPSNETIRIDHLERPSIIYISAYESANWTIDAEDSDDIIAIVIRGYKEQSLINNEYKAFVIQEQDFFLYAGDYENETLEYAEGIEALFGREPTTIWNGEPIIDGVSSVIPVENSVNYNEEVRLVHTFGGINESDYFDSSIPKYDSNVAGYTGVWWDSNFMTNIGYAKGRYYFECEMTVGNDNSLADWTNVGIGTDSQEGMIDFYLVDGRDGDYGYGAIYNTSASSNITKRLNPINSDLIKSGDIIGVAMNLDEHKVYFSLNGKWINGSPIEAKGGVSIKDKRTYYPRAIISTTTEGAMGADKITFFFKKSEFHFSVPKDYKAYDQTR